MTTKTEKPDLTVGERIAIGAVASVAGALLGSILVPGAGTLIGAKLGALLGGGSVS